MFSLFGEKSKGKTIVVLDVESGSVGGALVRIAPGKLPHVFVQHRQRAAIQSRLTGNLLLTQILRLSEQTLLALSTAASRMRAAGEDAAPFGTISSVTVLLGAPWSEITVGRDTHTTGAPKSLTDALRRQCYATIGDVPVLFEAFATAAGISFADFSEGVLFAMIGAEVTELIATRGEALAVRATFPVGVHTLLRTAKVHAGLSPQEVFSSLKLSEYAMEEPLATAAEHFSKQFRNAVRDIQQHAPTKDIVVVAEEPYGEWHARALAGSPSLREVFAEGGVVRSMRSSHLKDRVLVRAVRPDLPLTIGALYIGSTERL